MKKFIAYSVAFLIVWAFTAGMAFLINVVVDRYSDADWTYYVTIGIAGALAGVFGPKVATYIGKKFK